MPLGFRILFLRRPFLIYLCNALVGVAFWVYYLSDGFNIPGILDAYYEIQTESFRNGQISLIPGCKDYYYHDVSLYRGQYFFYWGLLPSLIHLLLSAVIGRVISSYLVASMFLFFLFFFFQLILVELFSVTEEKLPGRVVQKEVLPTILSWLFIFTLPFPVESSKISWFFHRFLIYDQAIIFGIGMAMPALYFFLRGIRKRNHKLLLASAMVFSIASWVRGTWLVCCIFVIPLLYFHIYHYSNFRKINNKHRILLCIFSIFPILVLAGLISLNYIRFDSISEFGINFHNPTGFEYLRLVHGSFTPSTQFCNFLYKIDSYYFAFGLIDYLEISNMISTWSEFDSPALFKHNPLMFIPIILIPYGLYRAAKVNRTLFNMIVTVGLITMLINAIICLFGVSVIMRFFIECYYFLIVLMLSTLLAIFPVKIAVAIMVIIIGVHLPSSIRCFAHTKPYMRPINILKSDNRTIGYKCYKGRGCGIYNNVKWHKGEISNRNTDNFRDYNTLGIRLADQGVFVSHDVSAVYIIPMEDSTVDRGKAIWEFEHIGSIGIPGKLRLFFDGRYIGEVALKHNKVMNAKFEFNYEQNRNCPSRLRMVFLPKESSYLSPNELYSSSFYFKGMRLSSSVIQN